MIIYAITNTVNGKRYVGMTEKRLSLRWWQHKENARRGLRGALCNALRKYGSDAFVIQPIVSLIPGMSRADLANIEREIIAQEGTLTPRGMNMTAGGDGIPRGYSYAKKRAFKPWSDARRFAYEHPELVDRTTKAKTRGLKPANKPRSKVESTAQAAEKMRQWHAAHPAFARTSKSAEGLARIGAVTALRNQTPEFSQKLKDTWANSPERRLEHSQRMRERNLTNNPSKQRKVA